MNYIWLLSKRFSLNSGFYRIARRIAFGTTIFGVTLLVILVFVLSGFKHDLSQRMYDFSGQYQLNRNNIHQILDISYLNPPEGIIIKPYIDKGVLLQGHNCVEGCLLNGTNIDNRLEKYIIVGTLPKSKDDIVIGQQLYNKLHISVGSKLIVCDEKQRYKKVNLVGVFQTSIDDIDNNCALCDIVLVQNLNKWGSNQCTGLNVFIQENTPQFQKFLASLAVKYNCYITSITDKYIYVTDWIKIIKANCTLYIVIVFIVILTNIVSMLIVQLLERAKTIQILQYLGCKQECINDIFLIGNVKLVIKSCIYGTLIAFILSAIQYRFKVITLSATDYYLNYLPIHFDIPMLCICILSLVMFISVFIKLLIKII